MVKKSELYFNEKVFPLRLIDVNATIESKGGVYFSVPTDWDFHVISHTWTTAIYSLSDQCKQIVTEAGWSKDDADQLSKYNEAFKNQQFAGKPYYEVLIQFLSFLQSDGVKNVWMDVLCINQLNAEESASEMLNMGAYYHLTKACYIAPHGLGTDWGFKVLDSDTKLPRWFSRVWTLQESMLPDTLRFTVEKFDKTIIPYLEKDKEDERLWIDWDEELEVNDPGDHTRKKIEENLYFLGAKAYFEMMHTLLNVRVDKIKDLPKELLPDFFEAFGELADGVENVDVETLVKQIRVRNASLEEDRVLGILGLIGFRGEHKVTSNQTLDLQLLDLAKRLFADGNAKLLVNITGSMYEGYETPGISWAPDLRVDDDTSMFEFRRYFVDYAIVKYHSATVVDVLSDGALVMSAIATHGTLRRSTSANNNLTYELTLGPLFIGLFHDVHTNNFLPLHTDLVDQHGWRGGLVIPATAIHGLSSYDSTSPFSVCDVTFLLLGFDGPPNRSSSTCILIACIPIGSKDSSKPTLHKIGMFHPRSRIAPLVKRLFSSKPKHFVIGGGGSDLTSFLHTDTQAILKSLA